MTLATLFFTLSAIAVLVSLADSTVRWWNAVGDMLRIRAAHERSRSSRLRHTVGIAIAGEAL